MSSADGSSRAGRSSPRLAAARRLWPAVLAVMAVAMSLAPSVAMADRSQRPEVIVVQVGTPASFSGAPAPGCPGGLGRVTLTGPTGRPAGTATICVQEFAQTGPTSHTARSILTVSLKRGDIVIDLTTEGRFFEADPALVFEDYSGTVEGGTRAYRRRTGNVFGGGHVRFNPDETLTPDSVMVIVLGGRR